MLELDKCMSQYLRTSIVKSLLSLKIVIFSKHELLTAISSRILARGGARVTRLYDKLPVIDICVTNVNNLAQSCCCINISTCTYQPCRDASFHGQVSFPPFLPDAGPSRMLCAISGGGLNATGAATTTCRCRADG
jgi:hypothetical protein